MLGLAFRRVLWAFPSALAVSLLTFYALSLVPGDESSPHHRYRELPLFFNPAPADVRARVGEAVAATLSDDPAAAERGAFELARLGGAALPHILPGLSERRYDERTRLALALAPVAERMGLDDAAEAAEPATAVRFWSRFWEARGVELRESAARSAVRRFARYGTDARAREVMVLDTYALPALFELLPADVTPQNSMAVRRLVVAIAHAAAHDDTIAESAGVAEAQRCVNRWRRWWLREVSSFSQLTGADRLAAIALETRYGKWAVETLSLGLEGHGSRDLAPRSRVTLTLLLVGWLGAYLLGVPLGAAAAAHRESRLDRAVGWSVLLPYGAAAAFSLLVGLLPAGGGDPPGHSRLLAAAALTATMIASPLLRTRAEVTRQLANQRLDAFRARGSSRLRAALVHGLRPALVPVLRQAVLELPLAIAGCFALEHALGLDGLGGATLAAIGRGDVTWLIACAAGGAALAVVSWVSLDVAAAAIDPRAASAFDRA